jgi:DNA-binding NarL/FixJ family response regulator
MSSTFAGDQPGEGRATRTGDTVSVLVACGVRPYREALVERLAARPGIQVLAGVGGSGDVLEATTALRPDLLLLDVDLPASLTTAQAAVRRRPELRVLALGVDGSNGDVLAWAEAGAAGYHERDGSLDELIVRVERVARGESPCSPAVAGLLFRRVAALARERPRGSSRRDLTARERQILGLIDEGFSNKEIGRQLGIRLATVKNHVHAILAKLGVSHRGAAAALARRRRAS